MKTAEAEHAAKAETTSPQQPAQKCQRVELPAALSDGTILADISIPELLERRDALETELSKHDQRQLELRAVRAEIRRKA
jgi:hypothetical protein